MAQERVAISELPSIIGSEVSLKELLKTLV